jgi:excisionase family DNA binding protein
MKETWITVSAFARATGVSYWLATQMVDSGEIPSVVIGKRRRVHSGWVKKWLAETRKATPSRTAADRSARAVA